MTISAREAFARNGLLVSAVFFLAVTCFGQVSGTQASHPFSITISGPARSKSGADIEIRIKVLNTSNQEVTIPSFFMGGVDYSFDYEVRGRDGALRERKAKPRAGNLIPETLAPGQAKEVGSLISRAFVMDAPGRYVIQVSRRTSPDPKDAVVLSNKIIVDVTP